MYTPFIVALERRQTILEIESDFLIFSFCSRPYAEFPVLLNIPELPETDQQ